MSSNTWSDIQMHWLWMENQSKKKGKWIWHVPSEWQQRVKSKSKSLFSSFSTKKKIQIHRIYLGKNIELNKKKVSQKSFIISSSNVLKADLPIPLARLNLAVWIKKKVDKFECFSVFVFNSVRFVGVFSIKLLAKKYWLADA